MLEVKPLTSKQSESIGSSLLERILSLKLEKKKFRFGILVVFIIIIGWILSENKALEINTYSISSEKIPEVFHGYRIAQVSDLHNAEFAVFAELKVCVNLFACFRVSADKGT